MRSLPHAYRDTDAESGATLTIEIAGASGGVWTLRRDADRWSLWIGAEPEATARVRMTDETAWRLLFNAVPADRVAGLLTVSGDALLVAPLQQARSVIV